MPKHCPDCSQTFPDFVDICVNDGSRLVSGSPPDQADREEGDPEVGEPTGGNGISAIPGRARLYPKVHGVTQPFVIEFFGDVVLGRFDPDVGAVDVDLADMPNRDHISPRHARLAYDDGRWTVEDLGSDNGVFVNRGPRITARSPIESGDELALGNALFVFEADTADLPKD